MFINDINFRKLMILNPVDGRKSFYNKARVIMDNDNNCYLVSYDTIVCGIENGVFKRFWYGYSATTQRHINAFLYYFDMPTINKKAWCDMPVC